MPPSVQWSCVAGLGPNISWCGASWALSSSSTMPGSTMQVRASASTETTPWQYFDQSMTTATLHVCPARLVPPPRDTTGAPCSRHTAIACSAGLDGAWYHHADRHLAVVRRVGAVGAAAARVEPDLAVDPLPQGTLEGVGVHGRRPGAADDRIWQGHAHYPARRSANSGTIRTGQGGRSRCAPGPWWSPYRSECRSRCRLPIRSFRRRLPGRIRAKHGVYGEADQVTALVAAAEA